MVGSYYADPTKHPKLYIHKLKWISKSVNR